MLKHSKKRNVGLINEFFSRYIAKAIIENKDNKISLGKQVYRKHFNRGTDLSKELKLFEALLETRVSSKQSAMSLISEVKEACKLQSQERLDLEKTALLHEVNSSLEDTEFFNRPIKEYQIYATIQILLNHWRGKFLAENISEAIMLEDRLVQHLTRPQILAKNSKTVLEMTNTDIDKLVLKIMSDKINSNFQKLLDENQKKILKLYVFANDNEKSKQELSSVLESMKQETIKLIDKTRQNPSSLVNESILKPLLMSEKFDDDGLFSKLEQIKSLLTEDYGDVSKLSDEMIVFYMSVSKLQRELL